MKKTLKFSAICLAAFAAISCSSLEINDVQSVYSYEDFAFSAQYKPGAAKTHLGTVTDTDAEVLWDNADDLTVFSKTVASPSNRKFEISNIQGTSANFSGSIEETTASFVAIYPYTAGASYSDGVISGCSIPTSQSATAGSFANGSALAIANATRTPGQTDCGSISFANLCSVISFVLPSDITFAKSITVTAKGGVNMAGEVSVDAENESISSASANSVTLSGTFVGGGTYYAVVAPGSYSGFTFSISTNAGNTYVRETTKAFTAVAGEIYPLGKLSLALAEADFTHSVTIAHDYDSQVLLGSTARLSVEVNKQEFAYAVKEIRVENVKLERNSVIYCTLSSHSAPAKFSVALVNNSATPYIPKGDYTYSADLYYIVTSSAGKTVERKMSISGSAASVSPDVTKFTVDVNLNGYTSYSCYKGTDGQSASVTTANGKDNATIYGVGATYKNGLYTRVYDQCSGLLTIKTYIDNEEHYGDVGNQSWNPHTISASVSFDGSSHTTCPTTRTVYVTGLPFNPSKLYDYEDKWSWDKGGEWKDNSYMKLHQSGKNPATATFSGFYVPGDIDVSAGYRIDNYSGATNSTAILTVGATQVINDTYKKVMAGTKSYNSTGNAVLTSSASKISLYSSSSNKLEAGATAVLSFYNITVNYR